MFKKALKDTAPVLTGYMVLGFGFGIIVKSSGYGVMTSFLMSALIYAGSMQYMAIGLITGGASFITIAFTTLMVNARHLFYGISMIEKYKGMGKIKPYLIFSLTDETYSLLCREDIKVTDRKRYFLSVSLLNQIYWVSGSVLGALFGTVVSFNSTGIDFALTALFLTVFTEQWLSTKKHLPAIIGLIASVISIFVFGKDNFLIPAMIMMGVSLCLYREESTDA